MDMDSYRLDFVIWTFCPPLTQAKVSSNQGWVKLAQVQIEIDLTY